MLSQWRGALVAITSLRIQSSISTDCKLVCSTATGEQSDAPWNRIAKNLDVPATSHDSVAQAVKGLAGDLTPKPLLSVVCPNTAPTEIQRRHYRPHGSKHLSLVQATNIIEAVDHARG